MAVNAIDETGSLDDASPTHSAIELTAPGVDVYSTIPGGYGAKSGASMAAPHVSGVGGLAMDGAVSNTDARTKLRAAAEDAGLSDSGQGYGLVNAEGSY